MMQWDDVREQPKRMGVAMALVLLLGLLGAIGGCVAVVWGVLIGFGLI